MGKVEDLHVYETSFTLAMEIFKISANFPPKEKYSLTSQIRRSSRAVCSNIAEGYRKRKYTAHFISKLTDADMENTETQVWLNFALSCNYINPEGYHFLLEKSSKIGRILSYMIQNPSKFIGNLTY